MAYADDISLVGRQPALLKKTLGTMCDVAATLELRFNGTKCTAISFARGELDPSSRLDIEGKTIPTFEAGDNET